MDKNKKLCELLGIHWHEWKKVAFDQVEECECGRCRLFPWQDNPNFLSDSGRIELLRIMEKREDWKDFLCFSRKFYHDFSIVASVDKFISFVTEPQPCTSLVDAVIEFLESNVDK